MLRETIRRRYPVVSYKDAQTALDELEAKAPDVIVAGQSVKRGTALPLLRALRERKRTIPVIVIGGPGAERHEPTVLRLGAKAFLEHPLKKRRLIAAVAAAMAVATFEDGEIPLLTEEEKTANLNDLEQKLNREMKCFAGKNQVYLQSFIGSSTRSRPRICLKCALRKEYDLSPDVYYEFVRHVCCGEPKLCEAVQRFEVDKAKAS
jgi:DNA-binding response OmpR family regulator